MTEKCAVTTSNVPGIWAPEHVAGWKRIVDRVHEKGGYIYLQLYANGRSADLDILATKGFKYVSAGSIPMQEGGPVPEPLSKVDILRYCKVFAQAAKNAVHGAGFDGVEVRLLPSSRVTRSLKQLN